MSKGQARRATLAHLRGEVGVLVPQLRELARALLVAVVEHLVHHAVALLELVLELVLALLAVRDFTLEDRNLGRPPRAVPEGLRHLAPLGEQLLAQLHDLATALLDDLYGSGERLPRVARRHQRGDTHVRPMLRSARALARLRHNFFDKSLVVTVPLCYGTVNL